MIAPHTRSAILALLAVDDGATENERTRVADALSAQDSPVVLSVREVCRRIGRSRQTVHNLVARGLLKAVRGGGEKGCSTGITLASLNAYLDGRAA